MKVEAGPSNIHGKGLFAKKTIKNGEFIGEFKGKPTKKDSTHVLWYEDEKKKRWKGLFVTNVLKYANHSDSPNVEVVGKEMYALRKIKPGEEITFHYGEDWN